jgi:hypothetical protein
MTAVIVCAVADQTVPRLRAGAGAAVGGGGRAGAGAAVGGGGRAGAGGARAAHRRTPSSASTGESAE